MATHARVFRYDVAVDAAGGLAIPDGTTIAPAAGWTPDHLLLAALVRCSIESLAYHARRAVLAVTASGEAHGEVTQRPEDGRYAFVAISVRIRVGLEAAVDDVQDLFQKAERDCFVGASLTVKPTYEWVVT